MTGTLREIANRVILTLSRSAPEELHEDLESYGFTLASENQARWFAPAEGGLIEAVRTLLALRGVDA